MSVDYFRLSKLVTVGYVKRLVDDHLDGLDESRLV